MSDGKWYFIPSTGEVTQGKESSWDDRMGPYDSAEEARAALQTAAERNKAADAAEDSEDNWGKPADWEK